MVVNHDPVKRWLAKYWDQCLIVVGFFLLVLGLLTLGFGNLSGGGIGYGIGPEYDYTGSWIFVASLGATLTVIGYLAYRQKKSRQ